jgi:hypothetical protein
MYVDDYKTYKDVDWDTNTRKRAGIELEFSYVTRINLVW